MAQNDRENAVRHPTMYLPHGDIVLSCASEDERTLTLFRVGKSTLAFHSTVFATMLTLPEGPEEQETYEGVPLVRMSGDTAEDLGELLTALYDASTLSVLRWHPDTPIRLRGAMKLATKYEVESVRKRIIEIMEDSWPTTLEAWELFVGEMASIVRTALRTEMQGNLWHSRIPEPVAAIRFAQEFDIPSILPFAFYTLSTIPVANDYDAMCVDGVDRPGAPCAARWALMDRANLMTLLQGRETLSEHRQSLSPGASSFWWTLCSPEKYGGCIAQLAPCVTQKIPDMVKRWQAEYFSGISDNDTADLLHRLNKLSQAALDSKHDALCYGCGASMVKMISAKQVHLWSCLPGCFGLKSDA